MRIPINGGESTYGETTESIAEHNEATEQLAQAILESGVLDPDLMTALIHFEKRARAYAALRELHSR